MIFREAFDPIRALSAAFRLFALSPVAILLGGFLLWVCEVASWFGTQVGQERFPVSESDLHNWDEASRVLIDAARGALTGLTALLLGFACMLGIAAWLFRCFILVGFAAVVERTLTHGQTGPSKLFESRGRWVSLALTSFLCGLINILAFVPGIAAAGLGAALIGAATHNVPATVITAGVIGLAYFPVAVYVWLGVALSQYAVAVEGMGATEAIARSWLLVRGHRWNLLVFWLVMTLPRVCCCLDCCLLFGPATIVEVSWIESYLRVVREGAPETWSRPAIPLEPLAA